MEPQHCRRIFIVPIPVMPEGPRRLGNLLSVCTDLEVQRTTTHCRWQPTGAQEAVCYWVPRIPGRDRWEMPTVPVAPRHVRISLTPERSITGSCPSTVLTA